MRRLSLPFLALVVLTAACASGGGGTAADGDAAAAEGNRNVMTAEDLAPYQGGTAYEAVERARRQWMRSRGSDRVAVYLDTRELGGTGELRNVLVASLREIRYLEPREAQAAYGVGYGSGVILLVSR